MQFSDGFTPKQHTILLPCFPVELQQHVRYQVAWVHAIGLGPRTSRVHVFPNFVSVLPLARTADCKSMRFMQLEPLSHLPDAAFDPSDPT